MKLQYAICKGRARTIEDAVEAWQEEHAAAMEARDTDELVSIFLEFVDELTSWCNDSWNRLFANKVSNPQQLGLCIKRCLELGPPLWSRVRECVEETERQGFTVEGADRFRAAQGALQRLFADHSARWPWLKEPLPHQAMADYRAGRSRSAKEIADELERRSTRCG